MFEWLIDLWRGNLQLGGRKRSPLWRTVRRRHILKYPRCAVTGSKKKLEVHHKKDFSSNPELELDLNNLITLRKDIHLLFGHLGNYKSINPNIDADVYIWKSKIKYRR